MEIPPNTITVTTTIRHEIGIAITEYSNTVMVQTNKQSEIERLLDLCWSRVRAEAVGDETRDSRVQGR